MSRLLIGCLAAVLVMAGCGGGNVHSVRPAGMVVPTGPPAGPVYGATGFTGVTGAFGPTGNVEPDCECDVAVPRIGPLLLTAVELEAEAKRIGQSIYWAGPKPGFSYEFTRTRWGDVFVRYLPQGVTPGDPSSRFLTVGTYPYLNAYASVRDRINAGEMVVWQRTDHPKNAHVAFRGDCPTSTWVSECGVPYEIEVYDPDAAVSAKVAIESGQVRVVPVG